MAGATRAIITALLICGLASSAAAVDYEVGGPGGWTLQSDPNFYNDQFKNITLFVGDRLNFTFTTGQHNVVLVNTAAEVANCDATNALIILNETVLAGAADPLSQGFFCGFPNHCSNFGMHFFVTFESPGAPAPSPGGPAPLPGK